MTIKELTAPHEFEEFITQNEIAVVDFYAVWCGDCKMIDPFFKKYTEDEKYAKLQFAKIDVDADAMKEVCQKADVRAMPTFQLFVHGKLIEKVVEPKPPQLATLLDLGAKQS